MFETDTFSIACELEVTKQVVLDYRQWLSEHAINGEDVRERMSA